MPSPSPVAAPPRPLSRSQRARRGSRSPGPDPAWTRARAAFSPVAPAGPPHAGAAHPACSRDLLLARDPAEDAVHEPACFVGRVAFRKGDSFVDRDLERDLARFELVRRQAQDVPLDGSEPVGRPVLGGLRDAPIELCDPRRDCLGGLARELVHFALVQRGERLTGHVPLIEKEERRSAGGAAAEGHRSTSSSTETSTLRTSSPHIAARASATSAWTPRVSAGRTTP